MTTPAAYGVRDVATALGVTDILVFAVEGRRAVLRGGAGRGAGWAGLVDVQLADEPTLAAVIEQRGVARVSGGTSVRIAGPYWSQHAALAHAGDHLVVFGGSNPIGASSAELMRRAMEAVAAIGEIPPSKLLADELELVQAVQQLNTWSAMTLAEAATHVAEVAADALSCEIGAVLLRHEGTTQVHGAGPAWAGMAEDPLLSHALHELAGRAAAGPIVEQDLDAVGENGLRVVSCYAMGIGRSERLGALIVGHTDQRPRGFTLLCQRVGRALADAAESTLLQAIAHDELAAQRDRYARDALIDPLTGLANRGAWENAIDLEQGRWERHHRPLIVGSIDVDDLKGTNDRHGHAVGDELLAAAAQVLRASLRDGDLVVRSGGDEFAALMIEAGEPAATAVEQRIAAACRAWRGSQPGLRLSLSMGWAAPVPGETLREAFCRADAAMYATRRGVGAERG
ncbi:MAG: GGDEF domain-containing protein [Chloroflexota bacterium]